MAEDPILAGKSMIASIGRKADRYKRLSRASTLVSATFTASIPILTLGDFNCWWIQRLAPAVLSGLVGIIQIYSEYEKPFDRWRIYRRYQRFIEVESSEFENSDGKYKDPITREERYREFLRRMTIDLHNIWEGLVPAGEKLRTKKEKAGAL